MTFSCQERNQRAKKQDISLINNGIMVFVMIIIDVMINERCVWEDCPIMRCEMLRDLFICTELFKCSH